MVEGIGALVAAVGCWGLYCVDGWGWAIPGVWFAAGGVYLLVS